MKNLYLFLVIILMPVLLKAQSTCEESLNVTAGLHTVNEVNGDQAPDLLCFFGFFQGSSGMWYKYQPTDTFNVTISTSLVENIGNDTRLNVYSGPCNNLVCVDGSDDISGFNFLSEVEFVAYPELTYTIAFDDFHQNTGFDFVIIEEEYIEPTPPSFFFTPEANALPGEFRGAVDMDGDFLDDILHYDLNAVYIGAQTESGFDNQTLPTVVPDDDATWSLAAGDLDRNGYNDVVYGGWNSATILLRSDDGLSFDQKFGDESVETDFWLFSQRSNMIDINNDGLLDVFVCHDLEPNTYFLYNGDDTFEFIQGGLGNTEGGGNYGSIWTDYDNDGDVDMFIAKCRGGNEEVSLNQMHRNNGDGTFTEVASEIGLSDPIQTWSSAWADFDNDGDMDVFVGASSTFGFGTHKYMENMGDGTFENMTAMTGLAGIFDTEISREWTAHDFDNDGFVDVLGSEYILKNMGDGTFVPNEIGFASGPIGDLNNDGFLDVVSETGTVQFNDGNDNNYFVVHLEGVESNINGIGARITLVSESMTQIRDIKSGDGFAYMSSLNAYFGLGQDQVIESVTVSWPSGTVDVIENPDINGALFVLEGSQPLSTQEQIEASLLVFPNPVNDELFIDASTNIIGARYDVFDVQGKRVVSGILNSNSFNVSSLETGNYILQVVQGESILESKFYKK
ncbi:MAG: FG-GAP-like repeat-containing protein [Bacteroidota bacterium]